MFKRCQFSFISEYLLRPVKCQVLSQQWPGWTLCLLKQWLLLFLFKYPGALYCLQVQVRGLSFFSRDWKPMTGGTNLTLCFIWSLQCWSTSCFKEIGLPLLKIKEIFLEILNFQLFFFLIGRSSNPEPRCSLQQFDPFRGDFGSPQFSSLTVVSWLFVLPGPPHSFLLII